ncbi:MAG: phosphate ABC transporter permease subunit PstC [Methylococcaceae bacterium]|nr:phosphate ABC transporter permease subunit PstC [Methylococcaceae bacterium]
MHLSTLLIILACVTLAAYYLGRRRAFTVAGGDAKKLHSLPQYYGYYMALWCGVPACFLLMVWLFFQSGMITRFVIADLPAKLRDLPDAQLNLIVNDIKNLVQGNIVSNGMSDAVQQAADHYRRLLQIANSLLSVLVLAIAIAGATLARSRISQSYRARNQVEKTVLVFLIACSTIAIFTTLGIVLSVLFEAVRFFEAYPIIDFLFGLEWSPQTALRSDQVGSSGSFGAIPLFAGTLLISVVAMLVAVPIGLMSAIYLSEYASEQLRVVAKPMMEMLAGIPTVVYGFFAALTVAPILRETGEYFGLDVSSESALAAGAVMGIMIIPFVSSLSDDVINAVPQSLRDGAYSLGATRSETIRQVVIPAALHGIAGGILLAVSRAIGETMIVVMAAGLSANLTVNPLQAVTTVTVQIVTLLVGDQEFDSPKTLAAFALGLILFLVTLTLNVVAFHIVRKYREQYE